MNSRQIAMMLGERQDPLWPRWVLAVAVVVLAAVMFCLVAE